MQLRRPPRRGDSGFTVIEMVVALTLIAFAFAALAAVLSGGLGALGAARQRSAFLEVANAEMERLRSHPYDDVGVFTGDPNLTAAYPGGKFEGHDAVLVDDSTTARAVTVVNGPGQSVVKGVAFPYTVRRWVTWHDHVPASPAHVFKRLTVVVEWIENNESPRSFRLTSVLYPGGLGASSSGNQDPTASIEICLNPVDPATCPPADGSIVAGQTTVHFDASGSSDADGDSLTFTWRFGDGTVASGETTSYVYGSPGNYTVVLEAADGNGGLAVDAHELSVAPQGGNAPPVAGSFTLSSSSALAPTIANVSHNGDSTDPDGDALEIYWDFGDGSPLVGHAESAQHTYGSPGTYTIRMIVKDPGGLTGSTSQTLFVAPLNCQVFTGHFENPPGNATKNTILVSGKNNTPSNTNFRFFARTNSACTSITGRIPYINEAGRSDVFLVELLNPTVQADGTYLWTGSGAVNNKDMFSLGTSQTGEFWSPAYTGSSSRWSFAFDVVK